MQHYTSKNLVNLSQIEQDAQIRILISESEIMVQRERLNKVKSQSPTIEEKIIRFSPPLKQSTQS